MESMMEMFPHPFGLLLYEHSKEKHPYIKLHRICECSEMTIRFFAAIAIAEIYRSCPNHMVPDRLKEALIGSEESGGIGLITPTFGVWLNILKIAIDELPPRESLVLKELPNIVKSAMSFIDPSTDASIKNSVYHLRNALAHDGRLSTEMADIYLNQYGHEKRFNDFWNKEAVSTTFIEMRLWGIIEDGLALLMRGTKDCLDEMSRYSLCHVSGVTQMTEIPPTGSIILTKEGSNTCLTLYPLYFIGKVHEKRKGYVQPVTEDSATQAYCRNSVWPEYTVFHRSVGRGYATKELRKAFDKFFPLNKWSEEKELLKKESRESDLQQNQLEQEYKIKMYSFRDITKNFEESRIVERKEELLKIHSWIDNNKFGSGLVFGTPGMGKSTLAISINLHMQKTNKNWLIIKYFFKLGDSRNSIWEFMNAISIKLRLEGFPGENLPVNIGDAKNRLLKMLDGFSRKNLGPESRFKKMVLLIDGVDEIGQISPEIFELIKAININNVVCVCFARPLSIVVEELDQGKVQWILGKEGLQPLNHSDVRKYLVTSLGRRIYEYLDAESDDGRSYFLDKLADKGRSLPLYLHYLLEDLLRGEYNFRHPEKLPKSVNDYFDKLLKDMGFDPAPYIFSHILAIVAVTNSPVTKNMLKTMLEEEPLSKDKDWDEIFNDALQTGNIMLRQAPIPEKFIGYTVYHESLRDYLLENESKSYRESNMASLLRIARNRVLAFCSKWKQWDQDSAERRYCVMFYPKHLMLAQKWTEAFMLLTDLDYLEQRIACDSIVELTKDIDFACANTLNENENDFLSQLAKIINKYSAFLKRYPSSLFQCVSNAYKQNQNIFAHKRTQMSASLKQEILERWEREMRSKNRYWLRTLWPFSYSDYDLLFNGNGSPFYRTIISGDGRFFAAVDIMGDIEQIYKYGKNDTGLFVWKSCGDLVLKMTLKDRGLCIPIAFGGNGDYLLVGTESNILVWDVINDKEVVELPIPGKIVAATSSIGKMPLRILTADGKQFNYNEKIHDWEKNDLPVTESILSGDFSSESDACLIVTRTGLIVSLKDGKITNSQLLPENIELFPKLLINNEGVICEVATNERKNDLIDTAMSDMPLTDGMLSFFKLIFPDFNLKNIIKTYGRLMNPILSCSFSSSSIAVLRVMETKSIEQEKYDIFEKTGVSLWSMSSHGEVREFDWPGLSCTSSGFSPDGQSLAIGFDNGQIQLINFSNSNKKNLKPVLGPVFAINFIPAGDSIICAGTNIRLQSIGTNTSESQIKEYHQSIITSSACAADGRYFVTGDDEGQVVIWDAKKGTPIHVQIPEIKRYKMAENGTLEEIDGDAMVHLQTGPVRPIRYLLFSSYNNCFIAVSEKGDWWVLNPDLQKYIYSDSLDSDIDFSEPRVWGELSADGRHLVVMDKQYLAVWAMDENFKKIYSRSLDDRIPLGLAISSDGEYIAIASNVTKPPAKGSIYTTFSDQKIEVINIVSGKTYKNSDISFEWAVALAFREQPISKYAGNMNKKSKKNLNLLSNVNDLSSITEDLKKQGIYSDANGNLRYLELIGGSDDRSIFHWAFHREKKILKLNNVLLAFGDITVATSKTTSTYAFASMQKILLLETKDGYAVFDGEGDLNAIVEPVEQYPFRVLRRDKEKCTIVELAENTNKIAYYHLPLKNLSMHPDGITALGSIGSEVYILRLDGPHMKP